MYSRSRSRSTPWRRPLPAGRRAVRFAGTAAAAILAWTASAAEDRPPSGQPPRPLLDLRAASGWGAGASVHMDRRILRVRDPAAARPAEPGEERIDFRIRRIAAQVEWVLAPFALVRAEAGWARAEWDYEDADGGLTWGFGGEANLAEITIRESPAVGRKESVGLGIRLDYRRSESDFEDRDTAWRERALTPFIRYERNLLGEPPKFSGEPTGLAMRAGLSMSQFRGDFGEQTLREAREIGLFLAADLRWQSNWTTHLRACFYSEKDRELSIGAAYRF